MKFILVLSIAIAVTIPTRNAVPFIEDEFGVEEFRAGNNTHESHQTNSLQSFGNNHFAVRISLETAEHLGFNIDDFSFFSNSDSDKSL